MDERNYVIEATVTDSRSRRKFGKEFIEYRLKVMTGKVCLLSYFCRSRNERYFQCDLGSIQWELYKRYSRFVDLHNLLCTDATIAAKVAIGSHTR